MTLPAFALATTGVRRGDVEREERDPLLLI
jgi:hypothetical protein